MHSNSYRLFGKYGDERWLYRWFIDDWQKIWWICINFLDNDVLNKISFVLVINDEALGGETQFNEVYFEIVKEHSNILGEFLVFILSYILNDILIRLANRNICIEENGLLMDFFIKNEKRESFKGFSIKDGKTKDMARRINIENNSCLTIRLLEDGRTTWAESKTIELKRFKYKFQKLLCHAFESGW